MALPDDADRRGYALVGVGLLLVVLTVGGSWVLAPERTAVATGDRSSGPTLVGVQGPGPTGNVTLLGPAGRVRWSYAGETIGYLDVTGLDDGRVLATFAADGYRDCGPYEPPCKRTGVRIIDPDPVPRVVAEWTYPVRTRKDSEVHDAEPLPSGEVVVADMEYESIFVVNLTTGERTWTWNASAFYDAPADPTRVDWLHINDVDRIGPGRFLVSVRNANQLLVVERGRGVVEVVNADGDPSVLDAQHNPQWLGDGAVLVADSENDRVVELRRNASTGEWAVAWVLTGAGGTPFEWPRDADRLPNGNTLVTDSYNDRVVEVAPNGSLVASYPTDPLPYEADRLPVGETGGRPLAPGGRPAVADRPALRDVPVLSSSLAAARHVVALPHWVSELHLLVLLVAAGLWAAGGYLLVRSR